MNESIFPQLCREKMSDLNTVDTIGLDEAKSGISDDVKERQTELGLKLKNDRACANELTNVESKSCSEVIVREDIPRYRKRRKTRRGRPKRRKSNPYSKLSWHDKREERERRGRSTNDIRTEMFIHGQPVAPYNTTQFLIDDHNSFPDLDVQLQAVGSTTNSDVPGVSIPQKPSRARDSSFSMDSDDGYFYSSPEDEGEFLTKEFSNTYEDLHAERLGSLSKTQLIQDYVQLEEKVDILEKKLQKSGAERQFSSNSEEEGIERGIHSSNKQINLGESQKNVFEEEMNKLILENERLTRENERLRHMCSKVGLDSGEVASVSSSVDSESDSSSSSCSSISGSACSSEETPHNDSKTLPLDE